MNAEIGHLWRVNHKDGEPSEPLGYYWAPSKVMAIALAANGGLGSTEDLVAQRERNGQLFERIGSADLDFPHGPALSTIQVAGVALITEFVVDETPLAGQPGRSGMAEHGQRRFHVQDFIVTSLHEAIVLAIALKNGGTLADAKAAGRVLMIPEAIRSVR
jgi:hypothetical protein